MGERAQARLNRVDLEAAALLALRQGARRPPVPPVDLDARVSRVYEARLAVILPAAGVDVLRRATRSREEGLALCRSGHVAGGVIGIRAAREMVENHVDDAEARQVADSFQYAAEAYVKYKEEEWGAAAACLMAALRCCREIHDAWGYPVEGRRVHLVCNLARNAARAGKGAEAARLAGSMVKRLDAGHGFWPYPELELRAPDAPLSEAESSLLADQALGVVAMIAGSGQPGVRKYLSADFPEVAPMGRIPRARTWVDGVLAHADGDTERFLVRCAEFFPGGPGLLSAAWREMVRRFADHLLAEAHSMSVNDVPVELPGDNGRHDG